MDTIIRIFGFVALAVLGYASVFMVFILGLQLGVISSLPDEHLGAFRIGFFGGSAWACLVGVLLGLGAFFTGGRVSRILFFLPLAVPMIYALCALIYYAVTV